MWILNPQWTECGVAVRCTAHHRLLPTRRDFRAAVDRATSRRWLSSKIASSIIRPNKSIAAGRYKCTGGLCAFRRLDGSRCHDSAASPLCCSSRKGKKKKKTLCVFIMKGSVLDATGQPQHSWAVTHFRVRILGSVRRKGGYAVWSTVQFTSSPRSIPQCCAFSMLTFFF